MPPVEVVRTYLRLETPDQLRGADAPAKGVRVERLDPCPLARYRALYNVVGYEWHWRDRDAWSDEQLAEHLARPDVSVWEMTLDGQIAGYFELVKQPNGTVEIGYFGLARSHFGRGLGKYLLTRAVQEAFALGASSVWLHTCTLDSKMALPNYLARGFVPFREERYAKELP